MSHIFNEMRFDHILIGVLRVYKQIDNIFIWNAHTHEAYNSDARHTFTVSIPKVGFICEIII